MKRTKLQFVIIVIALTLVAQTAVAASWMQAIVKAKKTHDYARRVELLKNLPASATNPALLSKGYLLRGAAYMGLKQNKAAIADFNHAGKLNPKDSAVFSARAGAWLGLGDLKRAERDAQRALALDKRDAMAYMVRASVGLKMRRLDEALNDYSTAIKLADKPSGSPFRKVFLQRYSLCERAKTYLMKKQYALAEADANAALKADPGYLQANLMRAHALVGQGKLQDADQDFDKVLQGNLTAYQIFVTSGLVNIRLGRLPKAMNRCSIAAKIAPNYAPAYYCRAVVLWGSGKIERALTEARRCQQLNPGDSRCSQLIAALEKAAKRR